MFQVPDLPYAFDALEPAIDAQTMQLHHDKHHQTYVDKLNAALSGTDWANQTEEQLLQAAPDLPAPIRNNLGGHVNHSLFWTSLQPAAAAPADPSSELHAAITSAFGSTAAFQDQFSQAALGIFGSGWAWLVVKSTGELAIGTTPNQDSPLMRGASLEGRPIFGLDVWEHAYYLKYQNRRVDYIAAIWQIVSWQQLSMRFAATA